MPKDSIVGTLKALLDDVTRLRDYVVHSAAQELERYRPYYKEGQFSASAQNLAHYLALRRQDLRPLQDRLVRAGLSSLGHGEACVLTNLDRIINLLKRWVADLDDLHPSADLEEALGAAILAQRTEALFGPKPAQRIVRIMVTLPSEAAWNYPLVQSLLEQGMDCARINCAHDERAVWKAMVANIRRAAAKRGQPCKILMDLAGHKVRTGPIAAAPAIKHIKVRRDVYGNVISPANILLAVQDRAAEHGVALPELMKYRFTLPKELHSQLALGDRLYFTESRGKRRYLEIVNQISTHHWLAHCYASTYLAANTPLDWRRRMPNGN